MWIPITRTVPMVPGLVAKPTYRFVDGSVERSAHYLAAAQTAHHPAAREINQIAYERNEAMRLPRE